LVIDLRAIVAGLKHQAIGWQRQVSRRDAGFFLPQTRLPDATCKTQGICAICGYALAEIKMANGWLLAGCSATDLKWLHARGQLQPWLETLPDSLKHPNQTVKEFS